MVFHAAVVEYVTADLRPPLNLLLAGFHLCLFRHTMLKFLVVQNGTQLTHCILPVLGLVARFGILNQDFLFRRSDRIRRELERKYGLHPAERKNLRLENPLRKVDASAGDVKRQVGNTVKALSGQYRFRTMGEYRALLSLYNMTVEEARGNVRGREYHGLVYSVTDDAGNKTGNPVSYTHLRAHET